jgi:hypothetical protein
MEIQQAFVEEYTRELQFLVDQGWVLTAIDQTPTTASVIYVQGEVALKVSLDVRDLDIEEYIQYWPLANDPEALFRQGEKASYSLFELGYSVWQYTEVANSDSASWEECYRSRSPERCRHWFRWMARALADMLRNRGAEILKRAEERFISLKS